jgi:hypothetical protein
MSVDDGLRQQIDAAASGPFEVPTRGLDGPSLTLLVSGGENGVRIAFGDALADLDQQGARLLITTLRRCERLATFVSRRRIRSSTV